jgi:phage tail tape-measure protein
MKWFFTLAIVVSFSSTVKAEVAPEHVESMLQQMVKENVISAAEAEKAKVRMKSMSPEQWSALNQQANKVAMRTPASVTPSQNKIEEVNGIDLDGAQFKAIQNEVRKIVPQYQD